MPKYYHFPTFRVDSVISGSFQNFNEEINKTPFHIQIILLNECVILDLQQNYTLQINQFPHTNFYYIDKLNQVLPNEKYLKKLAEYNKKHEQNIDILTKKTLQKRRDVTLQTRHDLLVKIRNDFDSKTYFNNGDYNDFRYIPYVLPFMTSKDSIIEYDEYHWSGITHDGRSTGGVDIWERKGAYSDFLYSYLDVLLPFTLPDKITDSIGWHRWYDSLFRENCFSAVEYAQSEHKMISNKANWISYFIPNQTNKEIYICLNIGKVPFGIATPYILNTHTDELDEKEHPKDCDVPKNIPQKYSTHGNEIAFSYFEIERATLINGVYCKQKESIPLEKLQYQISENSRSIRPSLVIHNTDDFLVFYPGATEGYNYKAGYDYIYLNAGKIDRKGEWIVEPKIFYKNTFKNHVGDDTTIKGLSFHQSNEETVLSFSDRIDEKHNAIIIYKTNSDLEAIDSITLSTDSKYFSNTYLLKKDNTYLLLAEIYHNNDKSCQLYYMLLNDDLTPKTDFVQLANRMNRNPTAKPILTSEGFMITWIDNDLSEDILRSVLIDKSGKQSNTINVTNQRINEIYNVEFDDNTVDIYLFSQDEKMLVRKRINKKEYGL